MHNIPISELGKYVAPNTLPESSPHTPKFSKAYFNRIMRYLRNSALPMLHRIEHKIIALFAKGEWIDNKAVFRRLEAQVSRLSSELKHKTEQKRVSFADTDRIRQEVKQMKAICQKLKEAGFKQENIDKLDGFFEIILSSVTKADEAITEEKIRGHMQKTPKSPKKPSQEFEETDIGTIINTPSKSPVSSARVRTPAVPEEEEEDYYSLPGSPVMEEEFFDALPISERRLIGDVTDALIALITVAKREKLLEADPSMIRAFTEMEVPEALVKSDLVLFVVENTLVDRQFAQWIDQPGGDLIFGEGHDALEQAYYDAIRAYSTLRSYVERSNLA